MSVFEPVSDGIVEIRIVSNDLLSFQVPEVCGKFFDIPAESVGAG